MISLKKIQYNDLNSKQQEIYNFQKLAASLADYGFNCMWLNDDWQGADFLAYHKDGNDTLKVQLKGRLTIDKKYQGKDIYMAFPLNGDWYLIYHDSLIEIISDNTKWLLSSSWKSAGGYSSSSPNKDLRAAIKDYKVT